MIPELVDLPLPRALTEDEALRRAPKPLDWRKSEEFGRRTISTAVPEIVRAEIVFSKEGRSLELRFGPKASPSTRQQLLVNALKSWLPAFGVDAETVFIEACRYGLDPLIEEGLRSKPSASALGRSLLATLSVPVAERLIEAGADVNAKLASGTTPLINAARYGLLELMRLLLRKGADPKAVASGGEMTALSQALAWPAVGKSCAPAEAVKILLEAGADPDAAAGGWPPLLIALSNDDGDSVEALLKGGADPLAKNDLGETAADLARKARPETRARFARASGR